MTLEVRPKQSWKAVTPMRIVSLNIRHGGGSRVSALLDWLTAQSADFILLTEWRNNAPGEALKAALGTAGYQTVGEARGGAANGLLVAAKHVFTSFDLTPEDATNGQLLAVDLAGNLRVLCGYFPQLQAKRPFFEACLQQAVGRPGPLLLIGDLNTGRNDIDLDDGATKFACADQFCDLSTRGGLIDLWRMSNGATREWSWRSAKNGFRIDHALANDTLVSAAEMIRCHYDHATRTGGLTDHSGLVVDYRLSSPSAG